MINITQQLLEPVYDFLNRIETDNGITMYTRMLVPGRRLIYVTTELGWSDKLFLPIRIKLIDDITPEEDEHNN